MSEDLKPCPFCGKPETRWTYRHVFCGNTDCIINRSNLNYMISPEQWNTRPTEKELETKIEILRNVLINVLEVTDQKYDEYMDDYYSNKNIPVRIGELRLNHIEVRAARRALEETEIKL